uniref:Gag-Pol polyprotein n=1 Tax=Tanacetum cinerariifolium TaxID=118510 RepID=A0A6L2MNX1_TANCI|nr:hypothetical protein [Tanacetum cinerariifolium]
MAYTTSSSSSLQVQIMRLVHYKKNEAVFTEKIIVLNLEVKLRDKVLAEYTTNLEKAEKERAELKLILEKLQNSSKSLNTLLDSQVSDKSKAGLAYKELMPENFVNSELHAPKRDMRLIGEHFESEYVNVSTLSSSDVKTIDHKGVFSTEEPKPVRKNRFGPLVIEDWHSNDDSEDKLSPTVKVNTAKEKVVVNAVKGNGFNAVKASACWEWRPKQNVLDHVSKHNNESMTLERLYYIDAQSRSKSGIVRIKRLLSVVEVTAGYGYYCSQSKDNKLKKRVLKNTNVKSTSTNVRKFSSNDSIVSNKRNSMNSNVCQSNTNVLKAKTVNAVNDGLNIVYVSCGKDVFMLSHEKCVARYAFSIDSMVKKALFTSLVAAKSKNLRATSVVGKSKFSVSKTPTATNKAPQIVPSSEEPVANEQTTPVSTENINEPIQEDVAAFDGINFYNPFHYPVLEVVESSLTFQDPSNMHEFYQTHRSTNKRTKNHPIEQVIGDPSKHVMERRRLYIDAEMCMYKLTVSTTKPKNKKEAMLDHSWIESMQDEQNQFKCLDV